MKKPVIHIGDGAYNKGPCSQGSPVLCGKTAGRTHGVMESKHLFRLQGANFNPHDEAFYSVNLTKAGIKACDLDYREVARDSVKMYGYYCSYRLGADFTLCQECLESEDFGLLALAHV